MQSVQFVHLSDTLKAKRVLISGQWKPDFPFAGGAEGLVEREAANAKVELCTVLVMSSSDTFQRCSLFNHAEINKLLLITN